ncbi:hypothetical protein [Amnibacterium setariae]|uniref:hypothetical protein n=1 Tax=Amnibacterium setariae TaxID=2306585 RepID=UPI0011C3C92E|nr:hypothetical protein [Amnibacterium setariae]
MSAAAGRARLAILLVGIGALLAALSGCAARSDGLAVSTSAAVRTDPAAVFDVGASRTVRAVRRGDRVCFFAGATGLVFPAGYSAGDDLSLRDAEGRVVAVPGFAVGIAFGSAHVRAPAACRTSGREDRAVVRIEGLGG